MHDLKWSATEKRIARHVFESALEAELADVLAEFKAKAASVTTLDEMWAMRAYLRETQREIDYKYDYRYSQLVRVFGTLVREGRVRIGQLHGLSDEKIAQIRQIASS